MKCILLNIILGSLIIVYGQNNPFDTIKGQLDKAKEKITQIEKKNNNPSTTNTQKAVLQKQRNEQLGVIQTIGQQPESRTDPGIQKAVAQTLSDVKEPGLALPYADHAVQLAPEDPEAHVVRADINYKLGDYDAARNDARAALSLDPNNKAADAVLRLVGNRTSPTAEARVNEPASPPALPSGAEQGLDWRDLQAAAGRREAADHLKDGAQWMHLGEYGKAAQSAASAIRADPANALAHLQLGLAELNLGRPDQALAETDRALALNLPAKIAKTAYEVRSTIHAFKGDYSLAKADAGRALAIDPHDPRAFLNRAKAREGLGDNPENILQDYRIAKEESAALAAKDPAGAELAQEFADEYERAFKRLEPATGPASRMRALWPGLAHIHLSRSIRFFILAGMLAFLGALSLVMAKVFRSGGMLKNASHGKGSNGDFRLPFELGRVIGQGGMGLVYQGHDLTLRRKVAIKELRPELQSDAKARERLLQEARTVAQLAHPNIVAIHSVVNMPGRTLLVFEYVNGLTLAQVIDASPQHRVPLRDATGIARQVCSALDFAHSKHVIHRDLKPSNIMMENSGRVKVMDFGIARQAKDSMMAVTNTVMGTPCYMAPEMEEGQIGKGSDLYSLGVCLYETLTGHVPFDGPGAYRSKQEGRFQPVTRLDPSLPPALDSFFHKALASKPQARHQSAVEFLNAFLTASAQT